MGYEFFRGELLELLGEAKGDDFDPFYPSNKELYSPNWCSVMRSKWGKKKGHLYWSDFSWFWRIFSSRRSTKKIGILHQRSTARILLLDCPWIFGRSHVSCFFFCRVIWRYDFGRYNYRTLKLTISKPEKGWLGGGNSNIFYVHPELLGEDEPILDLRIFFNWVGEKPPTRWFG